MYTYYYAVRVDPNDFGFMTVEYPYPPELELEYTMMSPPEFRQFQIDHPELFDF